MSQTIESFCVMCLFECEHTEDDEGTYICNNCGNPVCDGILDRDDQIETLAYENKMMALKLEELGYSQDQISNICSGGKE